MSRVRETVEYVTKALVDNPEEVHVAETRGKASILIDVDVAQEDIGRVIGRKGRHINAMRSLARALGAQQGKRVMVELNEPDRGR
jgi:predicted RNA-binding protein YlqC (UPF0109 family)